MHLVESLSRGRGSSNCLAPFWHLFASGNRGADYCQRRRKGALEDRVGQRVADSYLERPREHGSQPTSPDPSRDRRAVQAGKVSETPSQSTRGGELDLLGGPASCPGLLASLGRSCRALLFVAGTWAMARTARFIRVWTRSTVRRSPSSASRMCSGPLRTRKERWCARPPRPSLPAHIGGRLWWGRWLTLAPRVCVFGRRELRSAKSASCVSANTRTSSRAARSCGRRIRHDSSTSGSCSRCATGTCAR